MGVLTRAFSNVTAIPHLTITASHTRIEGVVSKGTSKVIFYFAAFFVTSVINVPSGCGILRIYRFSQFEREQPLNSNFTFYLRTKLFSITILCTLDRDLSWHYSSIDEALAVPFAINFNIAPMPSIPVWVFAFQSVGIRGDATLMNGGQSINGTNTPTWAKTPAHLICNALGC